MSAASLETVQERVEASGASCERVPAEALSSAIETAARSPAVATPTPPFPDVLASSEITVDPTGAELQRACTGVTPASAAVAESGSIVLCNFGRGTSLVSVFVDQHVAVVRARDVVDSIEGLLGMLGEETARSCILATGPSATADMGALVEGAHGPADVHVIIVDEAEP